MSVQISTERPIEEVERESRVTAWDRIRGALGFIIFLIIWMVALVIAILMIMNLSDEEDSSAVLSAEVNSPGPQPGLFSDITLEDGAALTVPEAEPFDFGVIHHRALSIQNQSDGAMAYYAGLEQLMVAGNTPSKEKVVSVAQRLNGYQGELAGLKKNLPAGSEVRGGLAIDRIDGSVAAYRRAMESAFDYLFSGDSAEIAVVTRSLAEAQRLRGLGLTALDAENARVSVSGFYDAGPSTNLTEHSN